MKLFKNLFVNKEVVELREKVDKLERIMKYSKPDGPSFRIVKVSDDEDIAYMQWRGIYTPGRNWYRSAYILYLYINNKEYEIDLGREVDCYDICEGKSTIKVYGGLAHLELPHACHDCVSVLTCDYEKGKFVVECKATVRKHDGYHNKYTMVDEAHGLMEEVEENTEDEP